ncbi:MAG: 6-bladed beta-propeller [Pseudarcicella sp.]|nr:6-bladed beta-propeller [Pseudarcicella sp.]
MKNLIIIFFLTYLMACNVTDKQSSMNNSYQFSETTPLIEVGTKKTKIIQLDNFDKEFPTDFFVLKKCFSLQTTSESLIGRIDKIMIANDLLFVLDAKKSKNLFVFDIDGNFKGKITQIGEGPNEMLAPSGFDIDYKKKIVVIFSNNNRRIVYYDFSLKPLKMFKMPVISYDFAFDVEKGFWINYVDPQGGMNGNTMFFYNNKQQLQKVGLSLDVKHLKNPFMWSGLGFFKNYLGELMTSPRFSNQIYQFDYKGNVELKYKISYPQNEIDKVYYSKSLEEFKKESKENSKFYSLGQFYDTKKFMFFEVNSFSPSTYRHFLAYNKVHDHAFSGNIHVENFKDFSGLGHVKGAYKDGLIAVINHEKIHRDKLDNSKSFTNQMKQLIKNTQPTDNPIVQLITINPKYEK